MATSSWGCMVFDSLIAIWFGAGAPTLIGYRGVAANRLEQDPPLTQLPKI